jgi:acetolactate synthase-1/2/3 large subunit
MSENSPLPGNGTTVSTGEAIVEGLIANGVDTVFGIPGVQTYELFHALQQRQDRIRLVGARHEQGCAYMALGYAQATGKTGVCAVVPGPGLLNAGAGLLTATGTSTPVLALVGEIPTDYVGRGFGHLHEMPDQRATLETFVKSARPIPDADSAAAIVSQAFADTRGPRPGPAAAIVSWDTLTRRTTEPVTAERAAVPEPPVPSAEEIEQAVRLLSAAENPLIMVGSGARGAGEQIRRLADLLQAPVVSFRGGRGIVSDDDPYGFTCAIGFEVWNKTDVLLTIGTRQELVWLRWPDRPAHLKTVNLDIDSAQQQRLKPDVALTTDAAVGTDLLLKFLGDAPARPSREVEFAAIKAGTNSRIRERLQPHQGFLDAIRQAVPRDGYLVEEVSQVGFSSIFAFPVYEPRHFITCGSQGNLGFGFPTALGVKVAHPDRVVISLTGDGGFLYGSSELATAAQENIGVITVVFNNNAFGNVKSDQQRIYGELAGADLRNPDFVSLAHAFGVDGYRVHTPRELERVLDVAIEKNAPAVVVVEMPLDESVSPWGFLMPPSRLTA